MNKLPRCPIPRDLKEGDILKIRNGFRAVVVPGAELGGDVYYEDGDLLVRPIPISGNNVYRPNGSEWGSKDKPELDCVGIIRKNSKPDKDAVWLSKRAMSASPMPKTDKAYDKRMRAIIRRLNNGNNVK